VGHLVSKKMYAAAARSHDGPLLQQVCPAPGCSVFRIGVPSCMGAGIDQRSHAEAR